MFFINLFSGNLFTGNISLIFSAQDVKNLGVAVLQNAENVDQQGNVVNIGESSNLEIINVDEGINY
jgi:hypothetical protein